MGQLYGLVIKNCLIYKFLAVYYLPGQFVNNRVKILIYPGLIKKLSV